MHELGGSPIGGSGSQDPGPMEEPRAVMAAGSQSLEATAGARDQAIMGPRPLEASLDAKDQKPRGPAPMEIEAPEAPREGPDHPASSILHQQGPP
jgi:hypothetical protein